NLDVAAAQPELAATRLDPLHCAVGKISAAMPLKSDVQRVKQAQGIHMTVERTEARTDDIRPYLRQHLLRLGMIDHMTFERHHSRLCMQAFERIGAIFHLPLRQQEVKAPGLMQAKVETGLDSQRFGELGPST